MPCASLRCRSAVAKPDFGGNNRYAHEPRGEVDLGIIFKLGTSALCVATLC